MRKMIREGLTTFGMSMSEGEEGLTSASSPKRLLSFLNDLLVDMGGFLNETTQEGSVAEEIDQSGSAFENL